MAGEFDSLMSGLFGSSGTSKASKSGTSKATETQQGTSTTTGSSTQTSQQTGAQAQTSQQAQTGVTTLLDEDVISSLKTLLPGLVSGVTGGVGDFTSKFGEIAQLLLGRAGTGIEGDIAARKAEATRRFGLNQGAAIEGVAQQIGSKGNTFAAQLAQQGGIDLETALAAIDAEARATNRSQGSQELMQAIQALATGSTAPVANLAAIVQLLTGAKQTTTGTTTGTATGTTAETGRTEVQSVEDLIRFLTGTQNTATTEKGSVNEKKGGLLGGLASIFG